jgi:hypothetical protein
MCLVGPGKAVVAVFSPEDLPEDRHRGILTAEADRTVAALERREAAGFAWPQGLALPREVNARDAFLAETLVRERRGFEDAANELDHTAGHLAGLGYTVHRLATRPERVRQYQSHTNVICTRNRLLMPLFPTLDRVHGWILGGEYGRARVDIELGLQDSDFELEGTNLAAWECYNRLHPNVRAVRDYFYLASGNVHCVIGRLS